jgi:signal peptide peptidase SppA
MADIAYPHIASLALNQPLMVEEGKGQIILEALGQRLGVSGVEASGDARALYGSTIKPRRELEIVDRVAIVPVHGTLTQRALPVEPMSGLRSYEGLGAELNEAASRSDVGAILLDIDSPGGMVPGSFELADTVAEIAQAKPVYAVANSMAFSAAYAIASQATRIYVPRTGGVGSIGVIAWHVDQSKANAEAGLKPTAVKAGAYKDAYSPHKPLSDEARSELQQEVDRIYGLFVEMVARGRSLSEQAARDTEARLFFGGTGIRAGLADQQGSLEDALADLTPLAEQNANVTTTTASAGEVTSTMTYENNQHQAKADKQATAQAETDTGTKQAAPEATGQGTATAEETTDATAILQAAEQTGAPISVARQAIADGLTVEQAKQKFKAVGQIRAICKQAVQINSALDAKQLEQQVLASECSVTEARRICWNAVAAQSESTDVSNGIDPGASPAAQPAQPSAASKLPDPNEIYSRLNSRGQG